MMRITFLYKTVHFLKQVINLLRSIDYLLAYCDGKDIWLIHIYKMKCFNELFSNMYIKQDNTKAFDHLITQTKMVPKREFICWSYKSTSTTFKIKKRQHELSILSAT